MYNDQERVMSELKYIINEKFALKPFEVPVHLEMTFVFPIPKSTSKIKAAQMINGSIVPMKRPDLDNCVKLVLDCMNKIVYLDDSQVTKFSAEKCYGLVPKTVITITPKF
jgi:Holliday junction resolvase RusA-like endonuclease